MIYAGGLASYYLIWKICMRIQHVQANSYQGINEVGMMNMKLMLSGIVNTVKTMAFFIFEWNVLEHEWTLYSFINVVFLFLAVLVISYVVIKSRIVEERIKFVFFLLSLIMMPFAACIWHFTSSNVTYRPMMLQSLCIIYIWVALLYDRWIAEKWSTIVGGLLIVMIFNNSIQANISYFHLDQCYKASYATGIEMISRIHALDDGNLKKIAVVGNIAGEVCLGGERYEESRLQMLGQLIESNILFDQKHTVLFLQNTFDLELQEVSQEELTEFKASEEIKGMSSWPHADAVKVIDDVVIIKLADNMLQDRD